MRNGWVVHAGPAELQEPFTPRADLAFLDTLASDTLVITPDSVEENETGHEECAREDCSLVR